MNSIQIEKDKCTACGVCVAQCPEKLFKMEDKSVFPIDKAEEFCLNCSHCVVFCPQGAVSAGGIGPEDCTPLADGTGNVSDLLKNRRSIRVFQKKTVQKEVLEELMELMRSSPTGCNTQMNHWLIISDRDRIKEINRLTGEFLKAAYEGMDESVYKKTMQRTIELLDSGLESVTLEAPHLVLVSTPLPLVTDCHIALTQLELAAQDRGLGTCWGGWINMAAQNYRPLQKYLNLTQGFTIQGVIMLGYPKYSPKRIPPRKKLAIQWT